MAAAMGICPESLQPKRIEKVHKEGRVCAAVMVEICPESFKSKRIEVTHKQGQLCTAYLTLLFTSGLVMAILHVMVTQPDVRYRAAYVGGGGWFGRHNITQCWLSNYSKYRFQIYHGHLTIQID
jgi:hypothetical protein